MTGPRLLSAVSLLAFLFAGPRLEAQGSGITLEFSFSNPGARSMGFGGAFAALADDATAAFANPAGLVQLARPEISIEGRSWRYSTRFTAGGRVSGEPTGVGLDTVPGLRFEESSNDLTGVSFLSLVYPRGDWSFAVYRHLSANFELDFESSGFFLSPPEGGQFRAPDLRTRFELELVNTGAAVAYRVGRALSVGLGLTYLESGLESRTDQYLPTVESLPDGLYGRHTFAPETLISTSFLDVDDAQLRMSLGLLWQPAPRWNVGAFFRAGPRFDMTVMGVTGPAFPGLPAGMTVSNLSPVAYPDVFGIGVAYRSKNDRATFSLEWDRVEYSDILDRLEPDPSASFVLDDADELHVGFEYVFLESQQVLALRVGAWLDPDHRIRGIGDDPLDNATFLPGDDEVHFAVGLGFVFERFQLDLGADFSDPVDTTSISAIYSF